MTKKPQIIEVREKKHMWEVVTLDSTGQHRYSYWGKHSHSDELPAFISTQQLLDAGLLASFNEPHP